MFCEERLRDLGLVSLKKIGLQEDLTATYREVHQEGRAELCCGHGRNQETVTALKQRRL